MQSILLSVASACVLQFLAMPPFKAGISVPPVPVSGTARAKPATAPAKAVALERSSNGNRVGAVKPAKQSPARAQKPPLATNAVVSGSKKRSRQQYSGTGEESELDEAVVDEDDDSHDDEDDDFAAALRADEFDDEEAEDEERKEAAEDGETADVAIRDFFASKKAGWSDDEDDEEKEHESKKQPRPSNATKHQEVKEEAAGTAADTAAGSNSAVLTNSIEQTATAVSVIAPSSSSAPTPVAATFASLGVIPPLVEACTSLGWHKPTHIQSASLPHSLNGRDVIGLAETGSGKTAAFALPILQSLLAHPQPFHSLILAPTRELAFQIAQQTEALGASIGVRVVVLVGGVDMVQQSHRAGQASRTCICATPGRIVDHLEHTQRLQPAKRCSFLVLDEADRLLNMDFEKRDRRGPELSSRKQRQTSSCSLPR